MASEEQDPLLRVSTAAADEGRVVVSLAGEVDVTTAPLIATAIEGVLATDATVVELDFAGVSFMDSSGLGAVIQAHRLASQHGATLHLGARSAIVDRLFDVSGVERALAQD